jgi:hypothetical protein
MNVDDDESFNGGRQHDRVKKGLNHPPRVASRARAGLYFVQHVAVDNVGTAGQGHQVVLFCLVLWKQNGKLVSFHKG